MWHGITFIDGRYPDRSGTQDFLAYGAGLASGLGFTTLKLEWSSGYTTKYANSGLAGGLTSLVALAQETAMAAVLSDAAFERFQINVFSLAQPIDNLWAKQWSDTVGDSMEAEFFDLCEHLLATYPTKEFVLTNWEGDWQLLNAFDPDASVPFTRLLAYRDYQRRRQRAMNAAKAANPSSTCVLRYGVECNRVLDGSGLRLHSHVLRNVRPDCVALSSYEAIEGWTQGIVEQAALEADIETKLTEIVRRVREVLPTTPIILSEYGWPSQASYFTPLGLDIGALHAKVIAVATSLGIEGEIPWQLIDNEEESPGNPRGFNMYLRDGNSTTVGALSEAGVFYDSIL